MMSDDSFIREVNEELRQDQAKALWDRYGPAFIGLALLVVLATAAYVGWQYWTESKANKSGDDFSAALLLANGGKNDDALAALDALEKNGYGAYPLLARMRAATVLFQKGDFTGAVAGFDEVSNDNSIPQALRDMARLRAALILVDKGSYADVSSHAEPADRRHQHAAPFRPRGARPVCLEVRQVEGCNRAVRPDRGGRGRTAQYSPARDLDVRTDPRFRRRLVTLADELHRSHHRPA